MKSNILDQIVDSQITQYQRDTYPKFVALLEAYYEYMAQTDNPLVISKNLTSFRTVDDGAQEFIEFFSSEYLNKFPSEIAADKRLVVKHILDLYHTKGTPRSIEIFFRMVYDSEATITYPGEKVLIASGSKWVQESSIRISVATGASILETTEQILQWQNSTGQYYIATTRARKMSGTVYEVFYRNDHQINLLPGDQLKCITDEAVTFGSGALTAISSIKILTPGKNYKVGQVFKIPGSARDTYFRVKSVGSLGELLKVQLIDFGFGNPDSQVISINPYASGPVQSGYTVSRVGSTITLEIFDATDIISDSGVISKPDAYGVSEAYFAEQYILSGEGYTITTITEFVNSGLSDSLISYEQSLPVSPEEYEASFSRIQTVSDTSTSYPGYYSSNEGTISDSTIRIQDSKYWQQFSYVISSINSLKDYKKPVMDVLHPSGYAMFADHMVSDSISFKDKVNTITNQIHVLSIDDSVGTVDSVTKTIS